MAGWIALLVMFVDNQAVNSAERRLLSGSGWLVTGAWFWVMGQLLKALGWPIQRVRRPAAEEPVFLDEFEDE